MAVFQQILFILFVGASIYFFTRQVRFIRKNILLGRDEDLSDQPGKRWKNMALLALGQKKMFKRPIPAVLHFIVYAGFIIINIEILEIILDGILGTHRLFAPVLGAAYPFLIGAFELLALGVLVSCLIFLIRRNLLKLKRLVQGELDGWPKTDANLILITEIVLMALFLTMNAADLQLQERGHPGYAQTSAFLISAHLAPLLSSVSTDMLVLLERSSWWLHIVGIFLFLNYLPYSKHLHILLAFPNAYYKRLRPQAEIANMPVIQNEVISMMDPSASQEAPVDEPPGRFGAKDVTDLSWKNLLDAYACTECGRCTAVCPANITGKLLSPRKIMMDTRDRMEELGRKREVEGQIPEDGKSLVHDYISVEEIRACTTCQACVEACPVSIDPLDIIVQIRRYLVMEESNSPTEWNLMFSNIETNMAPWKFPADQRDEWKNA